MTDDQVTAPVDVDRQLHEVRRGVTIGAHETGAAAVPTIVELSEVYATTVDDLWDACTTPERLPRWFAPVTGELRLGGRFQVEGNAGGVVEQCEPPHSFRITWEFGGAVTWVDVALEAAGADAARLTLRHSGDTPAEMWDQFGPGAVGLGWDLALLGMASHLAGHDLPPEATQWEQSDEAKRFIREAAAAWGRAAVAGGSPEQAALEAAERTKAFYLGEGPGAAG
ncbi:SRPBCC domain-containing protein [Nocardia sp. NPDC050697]|uniref:SRPBCC domain-containing protein n=1 Tax=Nocardia sp. NPDC050697 TaxID=3155158 RepID=UPI0033F152A2